MTSTLTRRDTGIRNVLPVAILESAEWVVDEYGDDLFDGNFGDDEGLRIDWRNAAIPIVRRKIQEFWMATGHAVLHVDSEIYQRITDRVDAGTQPQDFTHTVTSDGTSPKVEFRVYVPAADEARANWETIIANINPDDIAANL